MFPLVPKNCKLASKYVFRFKLIPTLVVEISDHLMIIRNINSKKVIVLIIF